MALNMRSALFPASGESLLSVKGLMYVIVAGLPKSSFYPPILMEICVYKLLSFLSVEEEEMKNIFNSSF